MRVIDWAVAGGDVAGYESVENWRDLVYDGENIFVGGRIMIFGIDLNSFFSSYGTTLDGVASIIAIISFAGGSVSAIYSIIAKKSAEKAARKAEESEKKLRESEAKIKEYETRIEKIETENAQIAHVIYNNGLSYKDTRDLANDIFDEKAKNIPKIHVGKEEPSDMKNGDIWFHVED